ncbi:MAG: hypothetical protein AAGA30_15615 [Planctomycetota bacterium]
MFFFIIIPVILMVIVFAMIASAAAKRRQRELRELASQMGFTFLPNRNYSYDERYPFLAKLCQGRNRYAYNTLQGDLQGHPVCYFDYHYETKSRDSKGRTKTNHHYFSFFILHFENDFPELIITKEGWISKLAQWFGYADIDFESAEFSRKFIVRSPDKKFAYDICHSRMIEYLLRNTDLSIEIERNCLTLFFGAVLTPDRIQFNLRRLVELRDQFPRYLMEG